MHSQIARSAVFLLPVLLVAPLMASAQTPPAPTAPAQAAPAPNAERSRTQGLKDTDRFVKAGASAHNSVEGARHETKNTLDMYNKLVTQPSQNLKGDYKKLMRAMDDMNEEVADARIEITNMQAKGDAYFAGRATTIKAISDPQLQSAATARLDDSKKGFGNVLAELRDAGDTLEAFRKDLTDQIKFLGSDLTPTALTSLKPAAEKLNARGDELLGKTDKANAAMKAYLDGLKAQS